MAVAQRAQVESSDLVVFEKLTPAAVFAPGGVNDILEKIGREVRSTHTDISTKAGREAVASLAYKVARSKTALDKMGKELGETHYRSWKAITAERSRIEAELDALRDEVRKPLTEWENVEKDRIAAHEQALGAISQHLALASTATLAEMRGFIADIGTIAQRDWQEFAARAAGTVDEVRASLNKTLADAERREAEAAELARLRAEQVAREQKERDDRIAAEAAERARIEAETRAKHEAEEVAAKAEADRKRVEQERAAAIARAEQAEAARIAAAAKAEQDAKDAAEAAERNRLASIEDERKRAADEKAREAAATAKREADKKHLAKINNEVLSALVALGLADDIGKTIVGAIACGKIPHTRIAY